MGLRLVSPKIFYYVFLTFICHNFKGVFIFFTHIFCLFCHPGGCNRIKPPLDYSGLLAKPADRPKHHPKVILSKSQIYGYFLFGEIFTIRWPRWSKIGKKQVFARFDWRGSIIWRKGFLHSFVIRRAPVAKTRRKPSFCTFWVTGTNNMGKRGDPVVKNRKTQVLHVLSAGDQ